MKKNICKSIFPATLLFDVSNLNKYVIRNIFLGILFLIDVSVHAQSDVKTNSKVSFSIGAGLNLTNSKAASYFISEPAYYNYYKSMIRPGFSIKAAIDIPIVKQFSLQPGFGFIQYNQKQEYSTAERLDEPGSVNNYDKITVNSILLNTLLKYKAKTFQLLAGPKIEYIISAKTKNLHRAISPYTGPQDNEQTFDFKKAGKIHNPGFGLIIGAERNISKTLSVGINYQLSFTEVADYYFARRITEVKGFEIYILHWPKSK